MADIKTRDAIKGTIKAIDKAAVAGERMKSAYIATKEKAEHSTYAAENSAEEYAADKYEAAADRVTHEGVYQFDKIGRKSVADTRENITHANEGLRRFQAQRAAKRAERQAQAASPHTPKGASEPAPGTTGGFSAHIVPDTLGRTMSTDFGGTEPMWRAPTQSTPAAPQNAGRKLAESRRKQTIFRRQSIRARPEVERTVKQSARSVGETTVKTASRASAKTAQRTVKTAEQTAKTAIKTSQQAAKTAQRTAQASAKAAKAAKASVRASRAAARTAVQTAKTMAKATAATVKAIIAGVKALVSALIAGGWIACAVIIIICLIGLLFGSVFGIFFSGEDSGTGQSMRTAV